MKRIIILLVVLLSGALLTSCGDADLKILLPSEYLSEDLVAEFEKEHNVKVKTITFPSNEYAITRLKRESFDLMIPSDYAIEQLIEEELILPIDWSKVELNRETDFAEPLMKIIKGYEEAEKPVPLLDYAVPYFWGNLGIIYNPTKTVEGRPLLEVLEEENWGVFLRNDLNKAVYDSSRDGFAIALKQLGHSVNEADEAKLKAAESFLTNVSKTNNVFFLTDQIMDNMAELKHDIALTYNGDAVYVKTLNENVGYYSPTNGTNVFVDGFVIPKKSKAVDLAYEFINFISNHDNAVENTEEVCYVSAIKSVYEYMITDEDSEFYDFKDVYMVEFREDEEGNAIDELFRYIPSAKRFMDDAWSKIRPRG